MGKEAVLLGAFEKKVDDKANIVLTDAAAKFDAQVSGKLLKHINLAGSLPKGKVRTFFDLSPQFPIVSVVGLGPPDAGVNEQEEIDEKRENIRTAVANGARSLRDGGMEVESVSVDDMSDAEAAAEGGVLGLFYYDELKSEKYKKKVITLNLLNDSAVNQENRKSWERGVILANGQNIARKLMETPANLMTPTIFSQIAETLGRPLGVEVIAHDRKWAEDKKMNSFLSVANGSDEPPIFLELKYTNDPSKGKPLALVGKGITFDTGGISIKPSSNMDKMRADMGGAANVLAAVLTLATLKAPVSVVGLCALTENMPSGKATKPGDVVFASNGKSIQIDNTDAEGRLVLADALHYAHTFDPRAIVDLATLTGAMVVSLGSAATGVFTTNLKYFEVMHEAGIVTGDRVWRMPLFNHYTKQVTDSQLADTLNIGKIPFAGGSCTAAAFLREFVTHPNWMHMDIAGTMENKDEVPYLPKGMTGRPLRTLVTFAIQVFAQKL